MPVRPNHVPIPGSYRQALAYPQIGSPPPNQIIRVSVLLRGRQRQLDQHLAALTAQPGRRRYLSRGEFRRRFGADPGDIQRVRRFARNNNLHVVNVYPARRTVELSGTIAQMSAAFGVDLALYRSPEGVIRGRDGAVHVPDWLAPSVQAVFGLDNRPQAEPHFRVRPGTRGFRPAAGPAGSFTPLDLAHLYGFPTGVNGTGQTIGIIELGGGFHPAELQQYFTSLGVSPAPQVVTVSVDGAANNPVGDPNSDDGEVVLDIEIAGAVAPGAKIVVYFAPNSDKGFIDAVNAAIHDNVNRPSLLSISWGKSESVWSAQSRTAMNQAFKAGEALGVTTFVAAGDNGSGDNVGDGKAHVDFPASSPFVVACGGTKLTASGGTITSETVWNDPGGGSTGGGVSNVFPVPAYQAAINPTSKNPAGGHGRGVPDLAADASPATGYQILVDGQSLVFGGTSAVAPLSAGLFALIQQSLGAMVAPVHPALYKAPGAFRDIVSGNNGAYAAGVGWDACTGLGSPDGAELAAITGL